MDAVRKRSREIYRLILWAGKDYPGGIEVVRRRTKAGNQVRRVFCKYIEILTVDK